MRGLFAPKLGVRSNIFLNFFIYTKRNIVLYLKRKESIVTQTRTKRIHEHTKQKNTHETKEYTRNKRIRTKQKNTRTHETKEDTNARRISDLFYTVYCS